MARSQHGHRVHRAAGRPFDAQGRHREQELPPVRRCAPLAERGERHVVDQMQPDGGDADLVHRERPVRSIASPGIGSEMPSLPSTAISRSCSQARQSGCSPDIPSNAPRRARRRGSRPQDDQHDVAGSDAQPGGGLGSFEVGPADKVVVLQELDPAHRGMSRSTPRPTTPDAIDMTVFERAPSLRTSEAGRPPYISTPHEHVGERIDVGDGEPVDIGADVVARRLVAGDAVAVAGVARPPACGGARETGSPGDGVGRQVAGEADRLARRARAPRRRPDARAADGSAHRARRRRPTGPSSTVR